ncbi:hypothetical protein KJ641_01160 [Patescibacteria group bacterium]|nr:hypothetical protein [Patescibacteria group bacterium]MBU1895462.1 hypothetical protein [Patescibacteria group bacterium]
MSENFLGDTHRNVESNVHLPIDIPEVLMGLSTISNLKEVLAETPDATQQEIDEVFSSIDIFYEIIQDIGDSEQLQNDPKVKKYLEDFAQKLGCELIGPKTENELTDIEKHSVVRVEGHVNRNPLSVKKYLSLGYTNNEGSTIRARVIAYHPE